ncbi:Amidohydrolase 2 [Syntrophomonas zehnderi OL-4]|uniref:Amidohydrolase 2 n=1 Tax=Syntrophomonas zehnderi OL-4 TaxID=690567 RepID=A0A0E4GCE9_9FIRM|nr:amidohydrolase family protein [Syntrophomonas zehnderi]CFX78015.1 Amidohydrolase 2 [Syntrophomonas zehnderi OL-4]
MIIDAHAHISNTDYGNVEIYLEQLKNSGIDQGITVPGGMMDVRRMTDYITGAAKAENPVPDNDYVLESFQRHNLILKGFACINPHDQGGAEQLAQRFKEGFRGLKLSPMSHQFSFAGKSVAALAACCGDHGFPLYTHVVFSPGASTTRFISLARQFPGTNFILGHMGFGPADREGAEAARELKNVYLETSTGNFLHIKAAVNKAGAEKIIFGSEFPLSHPAAELKKIMLLDLPASENDLILGGNIKRLLKIA